MSFEADRLPKDKKPFSGINIAWILIVVFSFMSLGMILLQPLRKTVAFVMIDDAMYYPRVAQNVVQLGKFTYDGTTVTNGFHPLWELLLVPVYFLVSDPMLALSVVYWMIFIILLAGLWLFLRCSAKLSLSAAGTVAAFFIIFSNLRSFTIIYSMLESHLLLAIYLLYISYILKVGETRFTQTKNAFITGLLLGTAFLARVDSFILVLCYGGTLACRSFTGKQSKESFLNASMASAVGCMLLVVPYLLINYLNFGHLSTVSAWRKQVVFGVGSLLYPIKTFYNQFIPRVAYILGLPAKLQPVIFVLMIVIGVAFLLLMFTGKRYERVKSLFVRIPEFITFACLHIVFVYLFAPAEFSYSGWYYISEIVAGGLIAGAILSSLHSRRSAVVAIVLLLGVLSVQVLMYPAFVRRKTMTWAKLEMADYMRENMDPDSKTAMTDSGIVSYFSQKNLISLNGLIGDFEMAELSRSRSYKELFEKYGITHLVVDVPENMLNDLPGEKVFIGNVKTKVTNFNEGAKPFTLLRISPDQVEGIMKIRYGW